MPRKKRVQQQKIKQLAALNRCEKCNQFLPKNWTHEFCLKCNDVQNGNELLEIKLEPNISITFTHFFSMKCKWILVVQLFQIQAF